MKKSTRKAIINLSSKIEQISEVAAALSLDVSDMKVDIGGVLDDLSGGATEPDNKFAYSGDAIDLLVAEAIEFSAREKELDSSMREPIATSKITEENYSILEEKLNAMEDYLEGLYRRIGIEVVRRNTSIRE